jgi:hypothetical protein
MRKWGIFKVISDEQLYPHMLTELRNAEFIHYNFLYPFNKALYLYAIILLVFPLKA